jgi:hypothetical protein
MAAQDAFIVPFAQASPRKQQQMIDELPEGELRDTAIAVQSHQADAFARDPFAAGTTLYKEVGPPARIDDVENRIRQARQISYLRGIPVLPFTMDEGQTQFSEGQPDSQRNENLDEAKTESQFGAPSSADREIDSGYSQQTIDPNITWVAGDNKRPRLPGSTTGPPRNWSDTEVPPPKQLDPFAGMGGPGFRLPGARPSLAKPRLTTPKLVPPGAIPKEPSPEEKQRRREQFDTNKANGRAWEKERRRMNDAKGSRLAYRLQSKPQAAEGGEWIC